MRTGLLLISLLVLLPAVCIGDAAIEARNPPLPEDNAWDYYVEAFELMPDWEYWVPERTARRPLRRDVRALLEAGQPALAKLREGLGKPCVVPRNRSGNPLMPERLGQNAAARSMARLLRWEAWLHAEHGDFEDAFRSSLDGMILGQDVARQGELIDKLVSIACEGIACHSIRRTVGRAAGEEAALAVAVDGLKNAEAGEVPYWQVLAGEHALAIDWIRWLRRPGDEEELTREQFEEEFGGRAMGAVLILARRELDAYYADAVAMARDEPWTWDLDRLQAPSEDRLGLMVVPSALTDHVMRRHLATLRGTLLVAALELHRARQGEYPDHLEGLVPRTLNELPLDPWTGEPFRYARQGETYELYAVGSDRTDDGGVPDSRGIIQDGDVLFSAAN